MNFVIIEDFPTQKEILVKIIQEQYPDANISAFTYPSKAKYLFDNRKIDLLLTDLQFSNNECGIEFVKNIKQTKVIAITAHNLSSIKNKIKQAGFTSYISKTATKEEILEEVDIILHRPSLQFHESKSYLAHIKSTEETKKEYFVNDYEKMKSLTKTESKLLEKTAQHPNKSNDELAVELDVKIGTLKKHLTNIYRKIGVKSKDGIRNFFDRINSKQM